MKKILLVLSSICMALFAGCGKPVELGSVTSLDTISNDRLAENQLMSVDIASEEEAKIVAEQYGIEFVEYVEGVAIFHTDSDPKAVIKEGSEKGLVPLYLNYKVEILD